MGAAISVNRLCTKLALSTDTLAIEINGGLRSSVKDKKIVATMNGKIINVNDPSKKITETVRKNFKTYIKSSDFKAFARDHLLKKAEYPSSHYSFTVMPKSFTDLTWDLQNIQLIETEDKSTFDIKIDCVMSTENADLNLSSTVSHMGQNFTQTINNKLIPVFTINDNQYSFDMNIVKFDLA